MNELKISLLRLEITKLQEKQKISWSPQRSKEIKQLWLEIERLKTKSEVCTSGQIG